MSSTKPKVVPVSELFDHLVVEYRSGGPPHSILFQTALRVCAEDSKRVQRGEPPSALRALAQRAHSLIKDAYPASTPASMAAGPGGQASVEGTSVRFAGRPASAPPPAPDAIPTPASPEAPQPQGRLGIPAPKPPAAAPGPPPAAPDRPLAEAAPQPAGPGPSLPKSPVTAPDVGPFDEGPVPAPVSPPPTFLTLEDAPPEEEPEQKPAPPITPRPTATFEELLPTEDAFDALENASTEGRGLRIIGRVATVALALLAAAVAVVILWPGIARRQQVPTRIVESFPPPTPTVPAADLAVALRAPAQPAATAFPPTPVPPAARTPAEPHDGTPLPRPHRPAPAEVEAGIETMRSPDWTGRDPVFVVHFSSYRSHENAVADAARLGRELGRPAHAVAVDLGDRGMWYRVVVGDFATAGEARAFRTEIAVRKPGEVSSVYRLAAP